MVFNVKTAKNNSKIAQNRKIKWQKRQQQATRYNMQWKAELSEE